PLGEGGRAWPGRTDVRTTPRRPARRCLLEFVAAEPGAAPLPCCSELTIGTGEAECYTPEYRALTRDFYLKF
ncbi:MAG: methyltransferase, partial [Alistipes sp.]|nr:methyltransferase [Alistipes sp.]